MKIESIKIEDLRGIRHPLVFPFKKGTRYTSLAIYGKNGTGKSSICDAWEWLYENKITHLAREGARENAYPHKNSDGNNSYIEVAFDDQSTIKLQFNANRITQPNVTGDIDLLRNSIPHPCHLRYKELQKFVYDTKADKYEYLAKYLGFELSTIIQNNLNSFSSTIENKITNYQNILEEHRIVIAETMGSIETTISENEVVNYLNNIARRHNIQEISRFQEVATIKEALNVLVKEDPKSKELAEWKKYKQSISRLYPIEDLTGDINNLEEAFAELKINEENLTNIIRIDIYDQGIEALNSLPDKNNCPLCDQYFEGNLVEHITVKHESLSTIKSLLHKFELGKQKLILSLRDLKIKLDSIQRFESEIITEHLQEFKTKADTLILEIEVTLNELDNPFKNIEQLNYSQSSFLEQLVTIKDLEKDLIASLDEQIENLELDESMKIMVDDFSSTNQISVSYYRYHLHGLYVAHLKNKLEIYTSTVDLYATWVKGEIEAAFNLLSDDLVSYFNILEDNHEYIRNPKIKLVEDRNKAIELEIEFAGETLTPVYKVLSESQINSFGLAIFLSAIKQFNTEIKFIILDDVINSFDAFKRPRVIDLINQHFNDYQLLVLTHDTIWYDRLIRTNSNWNRLRFVGWDFEIGPRVEFGRNTFEQIQDDLDQDHATSAGQKLGRYLEEILQILNHNLQTPISFKLSHEYTLAELYTPFQSRVKKKLSNVHIAYKKLQDFDTFFRNFCMHYKDGELTSDEINRVFTFWMEFENIFHCNGCRQYVTYNSSTQSVKCDCGEKDLKDEQYLENQ